MTRGRPSLTTLLAVLAVAAWGRADDDQPVRVTVVAVLASADHAEVHPKLAALAAEVRKRHEKLTGFRLAATAQKSIPVGESHTFALADGQTMKVTINTPKDKSGRIGLTLDAPGLGEIQYTCVCDKFVPVITPHVTKRGERLVIAVLAKPCTGK